MTLHKLLRPFPLIDDHLSRQSCDMSVLHLTFKAANGGRTKSLPTQLRALANLVPQEGR